VQNFLDIDPQFDARKEFRDFVSRRPGAGDLLILHLIADHTENVFTYDAGR
jgi:hypothetical protein